jgi:hypothetical protein
MSHHESLFFDHDAPTLEGFLEIWKLMDAERKRVFVIPPILGDQR